MECLLNSGYDVGFCLPGDVAAVCSTSTINLILLIDVFDNMTELLDNAHTKHIPVVHASPGSGYQMTEEGCSPCTLLIKKLNIYRSLLNMEAISTKLNDIIKKTY